ncbi:hypothetical protein [Nitrosomonas sp.]|uniref:hypothetical protein n=1 Tax=Nitrosomonas sp. TaxID=42353 RepID=UPI002840D798|nr:hypothetical protein [Nitrosomonas sp.]MDR4514924.1 hypothetical protein [Nitrosomonas sp.]
MMFIAHCFLLLAALQFIVITGYYASLRLAKNKKQSTLNAIQLRFLGLIVASSQIELSLPMPVLFLKYNQLHHETE